MLRQMFYTVPEAAAVLRVSRGTVWRLIRTGALPGVRIGQRRVVVPVKAIERLVEASTKKEEDIYAEQSPRFNQKTAAEKIEKEIWGNVVAGYRIGNTVYVNATPHGIFFQDPDGGEDPVVLPPSGLLVNAKPVEEVVEKRDGITFVRTKFDPDERSRAFVTAMIEAFTENSKRPVIIGSIIAAQAYPGLVAALCPAPGFERVPPEKKRMRLDKFTVF